GGRLAAPVFSRVVLGARPAASSGAGAAPLWGGGGPESAARRPPPRRPRPRRPTAGRTEMARRLVALALAVLATGCALGPNYKRPTVPVPPTWRDLPPAGAESLPNAPWWEVIDDPPLHELVRTAPEENKDLKIAVERVEEARARYGFTKADLWPQIDLSATAGRLRFNAGSLVHTPEGEGKAGPTETSIYSVSGNLSWELDFF